MGIHFNAQLEDSEYVKAIDRITQIVVERFKQPWLISDAVFALSPLGREQKRLLKTVHDFTDLVRILLSFIIHLFFFLVNLIMILHSMERLFAKEENSLIERKLWKHRLK